MSVGPGLRTLRLSNNHSRLSVSPAVHSSHIIRMLHSIQTMVYISIPVAAPCASYGSWLMADSEGALVVDGGGRRSKRANGIQSVTFRIKSDMYHLGIHSLNGGSFRHTDCSAQATHFCVAPGACIWLHADRQIPYFLNGGAVAGVQVIRSFISGLVTKVAFLT